MVGRQERTFLSIFSVPTQPRRTHSLQLAASMRDWYLMTQELSISAKPNKGGTASKSGLAAMGLSALGIVFGDIGTSPPYTLKTILNMTGGTPAPFVVLGTLSLILWTLIIVTSVKYVGFAMRIDNDGEGGILALMSLLAIKKHQRPIIVAIGLFGAALIYGDGAITSAISVLSALEAR